MADSGPQQVVSSDAALTLKGFSKTYPGGKALDDVGFQIFPGSVHALLGGNGSGKSTLVKSLAGVQPADQGGWLTAGSATVATEHLSPTWARRHGLRFVHQNPAVFPGLTVAENVAMGSGFPGRLGVVARHQLRRRTQDLLDRFDIRVEPNELIDDLRPADRTMLAIARALQSPAHDDSAVISVLVLDEPTAALPEEEVGVLLASIRRTAKAGVAVLYISHRLDEVMEISDRVTVLRDGRHVVTEPMVGLAESDLVTYIVGRPLGQLFPENKRRSTRQAVVEVSHLSGGPLRDVSFRVHEGEIVGIAGLLGSGRSEILRALFGSYPVTGGTVTLRGQSVELRNAAQAMARGIAHVPENRDAESSFPDQPVRHNITAANLSPLTRLGWIKDAVEQRLAREAVKAFRIKAPDQAAPMSSLSGGNQQKVVLARWLSRKPVLLLLDEPTQGVDVGARADAYDIVRTAVSEGLSVLVVSSDLEELAEISDRVLILSGGRIKAEVSGPELTHHRLTELIFSTKEPAP